LGNFWGGEETVINSHLKQEKIFQVRKLRAVRKWRGILTWLDPKNARWHIKFGQAKLSSNKDFKFK